MIPFIQVRVSEAATPKCNTAISVVISYTCVPQGLLAMSLKMPAFAECFF